MFPSAKLPFLALLLSASLAACNGQMAEEARLLGEKRCACAQAMQANPQPMGQLSDCQQTQQQQADAFLEKYRDKMREDESFRQKFRKAEAAGYAAKCGK
jgi:hypothetical protein